MNISDKEMEMLLAAQQGELDAVLMYNTLAKKVKDKKDSETFKRLAAEEGEHALVFKKITNKVLQPKKGKSIIVPLLYSILGKKKTYNILANGEYNAAKKYDCLIENFPEVNAVKDDEVRHGDTVLSLLDK